MGNMVFSTTSHLIFIEVMQYNHVDFDSTEVTHLMAIFSFFIYYHQKLDHSSKTI